jgi:hypothetical protein
MMNPNDIKIKILRSIQSFGNADLSATALELFTTLGYNTGRRMPFKQKTGDYFNELALASGKPFDKDKALIEKEWHSVDLLFQLATEDLQTIIPDFSRQVILKEDGTRVAIESYLFFAIELKKTEYSRSIPASITAAPSGWRDTIIRRPAPIF